MYGGGGQAAPSLWTALLLPPARSPELWTRCWDGGGRLPDSANPLNNTSIGMLPAEVLSPKQFCLGPD